ncbi:MAG TPA: hypothetical protein PKE45_25985, partial [Caldilineaceae bacterium]|nr:hypothetical protein [Caldilineaceae bacterium]
TLWIGIYPSNVIQWVNDDLDEHSTGRDGAWESGVLTAGESYQIKLDAEGAYTYADGVHPLSTGTIVVQQGGGEEPPPAHQLFLPLVSR